MRKTLLMAAAALAAGIISSQAGVYSQNIVGYVNLTSPLGYLNIANPLDEGNGDWLTNVLSNPTGALNYNYVYIWTGTGFTTYTIDNTFPTGLADQNDSVAEPSPLIKAGQAFFFYNVNAATTITVVGTVHVDAAATGSQTVGTATNTFGTSPANNFYGSVIPVGGTLGSIGFPTNGPADYNYIHVPIINGSGALTGFTTYTVDSSLGGFADQNDSISEPDPVLPVGAGFFFENVSGSPVLWVQSY